MRYFTPFIQQGWQRLRPKARVLMLIALIGLPIATAAAVLAVTQTGAKNRAVVIFAGDSNITMNAQYLEWTLTSWSPHQDNSYVPVMVSRYGTGIRSADCLINTPCTTHDYWKIKLGATFSKVNADTVVTDLGINDALFQGGATTVGYANYPQKIDWFMSLIPKTKPVYWINMPCAIEPSDYQAGCRIIDFALANAQSRWPNLQVINWLAIANYHPEYIKTGDVHYTDVGYMALDKLIVDTLDAKFPVPQ